MPVIRIDYTELLTLLMCMGFFVHGARMDLRSPVRWGGLSLGLWLLFAYALGFGFAGGVVSQVLLFLGLAGWEELRERRRRRPG